MSNRELDMPYSKLPFKLSWTHYQVLMRIEDKDERSFYEKEAMRSNWNVSTLKRQYHSSLYERIALSRDKEDVLRLANEGAVPQKPQDILHTPYVLESNHTIKRLNTAFDERAKMKKELSKICDFIEKTLIFMINDLVDAFHSSYNTALNRVDMLVKMNIIKRRKNNIETESLPHRSILIYLWIPNK